MQSVSMAGPSDHPQAGIGGPVQQQGVQQQGQQQQQQTPYATSIAQSMTIDEMRDLHRRAVRDAEAKRTELRLVLASRYRELVGSSDEVLRMRERAGELDGLVGALPGLMEKLVRCAEEGPKAAERPTAVAPGGRRPGSVVVVVAAAAAAEEEKDEETRRAEAEREAADRVLHLRRELSRLPRAVHRSLDASDVHGAASGLTALFSVVSGLTDAYPLANALSSPDLLPPGGPNSERHLLRRDAALRAQVKMTYLHVQTLPARTVKMARRLLHRPAGDGKGGAEASARALSALDLLDPSRKGTPESRRSTKLIDLYYDSKAALVRNLLGRLREGGDAASDDAADEVLSRIVSILQRDVILHPHQMFVLRRFVPPREGGGIGGGGGGGEGGGGLLPPTELEERVVSTLPPFDRSVLKSKASNFLASFLPLIRTKVKSVLMSIAGTTAARLGNIRQSLYDKTDGADVMRSLDENGLCRWDEAVNAVVDGRTVSAHGTTAFVAVERDAPAAGGGAAAAAAAARIRGSAASANPPAVVRRFSLWSALFSGTFSSLVHSILTASFHSVHARVVSTLRSSLRAAPPLRSIRPHEAHRNALRIATDLDRALRRVSDDAHELLVHAEEREESERRLRQSLYVQTCEIMGRLLNELRRMLPAKGIGRDGGVRKAVKDEDATTELIVGRLCHLLKFRLSSLPTLLDPANSPAALASASTASSSGGAGGGGGGLSGHGRDKLGMITLDELRSAFELADDDDDGLVSLEEAMEAMESAFSGTSFKGAEMVRDTLLLSSSSSPVTGRESSGGPPRNVTLPELVLLSARGLRHADRGPESALGALQGSLDEATGGCASAWAGAALGPALAAFDAGSAGAARTAGGRGEAEWRRLHGLSYGGSAGEGTAFVVGSVSSHVAAYLLALASTFHQSVCPSDSLPPVPSAEYAAALGIEISGDDAEDEAAKESIPNMMRILRGALLEEAACSLAERVEGQVLPKREDEYEDAGGVEVVDDNVDAKSPLQGRPTSALIQMLLDATFVEHCFFRRNKHGFAVLEKTGASPRDGLGYDMEEEEIEEERGPELARKRLGAAADAIRSCLNYAVLGTTSDGLNDLLHERHLRQLASCDLLLMSLFGEDRSSSALSGGSGYSSAASASAGGGAVSAPLLEPLHSTRRFALLPIQAERSLEELRLRGKYGKEKEEDANKDTTDEGVGGAVSGAVSTGFGFFSNMLKKK